MNMNDIVSLINGVGFPILCCIVMAYYIRELTKSHKNEMDSVVASINANTEKMIEMVTLIKERLGREEDEKK